MFIVHQEYAVVVANLPLVQMENALFLDAPLMTIMTTASLAPLLLVTILPMVFVSSAIVSTIPRLHARIVMLDLLL